MVLSIPTDRSISTVLAIIGSPSRVVSATLYSDTYREQKSCRSVTKRNEEEPMKWYNYIGWVFVGIFIVFLAGESSEALMRAQTSSP
jgi:hypothetical protein